jgi:xanthosine utilization system XapX-like protein
MNGKWQYFLNSLATVGGNLFVLTVFVLILLGLVLYTLRVPSANPQVVTTIVGTFGSFSGALLLGLKGRSTDTNPSNVTSTTTTTSSPDPSTKP